eukprot:3194202-Amphidinium_carterae.1
MVLVVGIVLSVAGTFTISFSEEDCPIRLEYNPVLLRKNKSRKREGITEYGQFANRLGNAPPKETDQNQLAGTN